MSGEWEDALNHMDGVKMIALTESGTMPNPDNVSTFATWWSWFSLWTGSFIRDVPLSLLQQAYNDPDMITLDELPDWRHYTSVESPNEKPEDYALTIYPNPGNARVSVQVSLPQRAQVNIVLNNAIGQRLQVIHSGFVSAGRHLYLFSANDLASGLYWVRVETAGKVLIREKFTILK
jgi:mannan endo-1,4-beta-mannosidase